MSGLAETVYNVAPVWAQNALLSVYGRKLRKLRYGGVHPAELDSLRQSQHWSADQLHALQQQRLTSLLEHACAHVPWYRARRDAGEMPAGGVSPETLGRLVPPLSKASVRAEPAKFVSAAIPASELTYIHTSGTSGSPLPVAATHAAIQRNYAFFARFLEWGGVDPFHRGATFAGRLVVPAARDRPPFWRHNRAMDTLLCSSYHLSERNIGAYVDALAAFNPRFIDSYPSAVTEVADYILGAGLVGKVRPQVVITSSETLLGYQREKIGAAFGCPVRDHYGCAEMTAFITECEQGSYHVNPEYGIVEIVREDGSASAPGELGEMCCTGFVNPAMPLIRYMTGDLARLDDKPCACGRNMPVIAELVGRLDDNIVTPEGRLVGRLDPAFKGARGIKEAQIIQTARDRIEVLMVADRDYSPDNELLLRESLQKRVGPSMEISFRLTGRIPRQPNGKFRSVINLAKQA